MPCVNIILPTFRFLYLRHRVDGIVLSDTKLVHSPGITPDKSVRDTRALNHDQTMISYYVHLRLWLTEVLPFLDTAPYHCDGTYG